MSLPVTQTRGQLGLIQISLDIFKFNTGRVKGGGGGRIMAILAYHFRPLDATQDPSIETLISTNFEWDAPLHLSEINASKHYGPKL